MAQGFELLSDLHKDARGFRPSADYMADFRSKTLAEQQAAWDSLVREVEESIDEDRRREAEALVAFNARLDGMMRDFSIDRATALRWDMEAYEADVEGALEAHGDASQEIEHYLWQQGIAFREMPAFTAIIMRAFGLAA